VVEIEITRHTTAPKRKPCWQRRTSLVY